MNQSDLHNFQKLWTQVFSLTENLFMHIRFLIHRYDPRHENQSLKLLLIFTFSILKDLRLIYPKPNDNPLLIYAELMTFNQRIGELYSRTRDLIIIKTDMTIHINSQTTFQHYQVATVRLPNITEEDRQILLQIIQHYLR